LLYWFDIERQRPNAQGYERPERARSVITDHRKIASFPTETLPRIAR
jgi:hypothetical protein